MYQPNILTTFFKYLLWSYIFIYSTNLSAQLSFSEAFQNAEIAIDNYNLSQVETLLRRNLKTTSKTEQIDSLLIRSKYQFAKGNYVKAKSIAKDAHTLATTQSDASYLFRILSWQGRLHIEWLEVDQAKTVLTQALAISSKNQYSNTEDYQLLQYYWGLLQIAEKKYTTADSVFNDLLSHSTLEKRLDNLLYKVKLSLGESKGEQEIFKQADSLLSKTHENISQIKGTNHILKIFTYNHLIRFYTETEKYQAGINAFKEVTLIVDKNNLPNDHPIYGRLLFNYARLLLRMGDFEKAEENLLNTEKIYLKTYGETTNYALMIASLELLYNKIGQQEKELSYSIKQKDILKISGRFIAYAQALNNLSTIYIAQSKFQEAEKQFTEGINILKAHNQIHTSLYAALLMNYAALNIDLGKYEKAQNLSEESRTILAKVFSTKHPWYAAVINNLAYLYKTTKDYPKAKIYYLETEKIDGETLGRRHPYYIGTTYDLANIHELTNEIDTAYHYYQVANEGQINLIYKYYSGFDEAVRLAYLAKTENDFHHFLSFAYRHQDKIPELSKDLQNINLAIKNLALDFSADNQAVVNEITDTTVAKKYKDWLSIKKQLSQSYIQSSEEQATAGIDVKALEEQAELLEKELIRSEVVNTSKLADQDRTTFEELKAAIPSDAAVIDFIRFPYYAPDRLTDSVFYGALINRKDFVQPKLIWLGEEKELKRFLRSNVRLNGGNYIENERIGKGLYQQIWQPLLPYLKDVKNINISSSGLLHKVAFAALSSNGEPLLDQYNFTYYGNLRSFKPSIQESKLQQNIALFGGANFTLDSLALTQIAQQQQKNKLVNLIVEPTEILATTDTNNTRSSVVFNYLSGTKKEVDHIAQQFKTHNWNAQSFTATNALEENFKTLSGKNAPSILHIATHGYFFAPLKEGRKVPSNARGRIMSATNPLLRSGLAFTGANYSWKLGKNIPDLEDGILTAYEIANQNLTNTNLVVLSACETGLGDVVNGEGVFGLQRAFKMAGVKNMLISLWKVPDQQTQELMTTFYQYYLQSQDASQALYQAQLQMSEQYRPFYWAGFILAK